MSDNKQIESLATYYCLGRSGLRVSPLCLGTMTFGNEGWGADEKTSRQIYNRYLEAGGNFIDTADLYSGGESERLLGKFFKEDKNRDRIVLATKFNFNAIKSDPNAGGNHRKHIREAVEASLQRLQTDYIDLYWMHAWDTVTPVEEVMSTLNSLVEQGKIRYIAFSDTPAWYVGAAAMLADQKGWARPIALQLEYSLSCRDIEYEFVDLAQNMDVAICPWSPLAGGLLTGKYTRDKTPEGRLKELKDSGNPIFKKLTERNFKIVDVLVEVAKQAGRPPAEVALNWVARRPGVTSTLIGATKIEQLESNLQALEFDLPQDALKRLDEAGRPGEMTPYMFYQGHLKGMTFGERPVHREPPWFR